MSNQKSRSFHVACVIAFGVICLGCYVLSPSAVSPTGNAAWYSIVPPLLAVTLALMTGRMLVSLTAAVVVGGLLAVFALPESGENPLLRATGLEFLAGTFFDSTKQEFVASNLQILLYVVLIMVMISVMLVGGGLQGIAAWLSRYARGPRSTKLVTMAVGLIIFIDDYANTMIIGSTMRPVTDAQKISREKLAFLVDATAAPIAGIAVISTWIGYEVGLLNEVAEGLAIQKDGYGMFFDALGYRFYCIGMIGFVFFNALFDVDFGPMATAERLARERDTVEDHAEVVHVRRNARASTALVPMIVLLVTFLGSLWHDGGGWAFLQADPWAPLRLDVWRSVFSEANSIPLLAIASGVGLVTAVFFARVVGRVTDSDLLRAAVSGVRTSLMPVSVLVLAWSLKGVCDADVLGTGVYLANALGDTIPPFVFPALVFIVAGLTAFATGTSWGTMAILIPTAIPVAFQLDGGLYGPITILSIAAVLDGAICGDHCSPISDTTIMSSTASSCNHLAHVRTQMPYAMFVAATVLALGYIPAALGASKWLGILGSVGVSGTLFLVLGLRRGTKNG